MSGDVGGRSSVRVDMQTGEATQIEVMRQLVGEAEKWSELLLRYSRSLIVYFLPATILALGVMGLDFLYVAASWVSWSATQQAINAIFFLILLIIALWAVRKEADAVLRHRLNKRRHREWKRRFESLREAERRLEDLLGSQQLPESKRQSEAEAGSSS